MIAYLDTHVAVWLHAGLTERLSSQAKKSIEASDILISPMVLLELQFLYDRKRIAVKPNSILSDLTADFGLAVCNLPFPVIIAEALDTSWTSDPFDRIITAHAEANRNSPLITADAVIRKHYRRAVW